MVKQTGIEVDADLTGLPGTQLDPSEALQLLGRSAHAALQVGDVDLNNLCARPDTGVGDQNP